MSKPAEKDGQGADFFGAVEIANHLLDKFGVAKRIKCINECNDEYFLTLYEAITGEFPFGVVQYPSSEEERITNCQLVIDSLSKEVLETDLSHIQGKDIVHCNLVSVANLLEIFMGLLEYIFEELKKEEEGDVTRDDENPDDDSNLLPSDHEVLSDVMHEAFGGVEAENKAKRMRSKDGQQSILEKYLLPTEAPTRDTDTESLSSHDFTQDSLFNQGPKATVKRGQHVNSEPCTTFDIHPFAYVSSSKSSSTEDLAKEAELLEKNYVKPGFLDVKSASTSRLPKQKQDELNSPQKEFRRTDPTLGTSLSKKMVKRTALPSSSLSSASWPSILNTNELKEQTANNPYKDVGKRPRGPLPCEIDKTSDDSSEASSVKHQHTHHHYHHYDTAKANEPRPKVKIAASSNRPSTKNAKSDSQGNVTIQQSLSPLDGVIPEAAPEDKKGTIRMRSVQTSVSGLETNKKVPGSEATSKPPVSEAITRLPGLGERIMSRLATKFEAKTDATASDGSTVWELNELLHERKKADAEDTSRTDVLKELNKKLEEVRAAVKKLDRNKLLSLDTEKEGIEALSRLVRPEDKKQYPSLASRGLPDNDSICSDSEFDYDYVTHRISKYADDSHKLPKSREEAEIAKRKPYNDILDYDDDNGVKKYEFKQKKKVHFKDFVTESRDERLERLIKSLKEEDQENKGKIDDVKNSYARDLKNAHKKYAMKGEGKKDLLAKKALQTVTVNKGASRLARVYGQRSRASQRQVSKQRKRSASCSPVPRARRKGRLVVDEEDIIPLMEDEFPHLYLSPVTAKMMWQKQMHQISNLTKAAQLRRPTIVEKRIEESQKKQAALMNIMKKEVEHNTRLKEAREKAHEKRQVKNKLRERRLASARARRYYDEYQIRMRAKMLKRKTKEEKVFKKLFEDALDIQKERIRELREYAKEQRALDSQRKQNELESIDNFYRDQFAMMAESVARERYEIQVREKAQSKVIENMRKGIRQRMEKDIKELQEQLVRDEDSAYFRQLDADTLRKELQMATYKVRM